MIILESFSLSVVAYTRELDSQNFDQKAFHLQKMLSLISRFQKMKNLEWATQTKLASSKILLVQIYTSALSRDASRFESYLKTE